jgi:hypothetical protein
LLYISANQIGRSVVDGFTIQKGHGGYGFLDVGELDARKKFRLSHAQVQMARELGLNPKKFWKLASHRQEPWKIPLPQYIQYLYRKHFKKDRLENVITIEEKVKLEHLKKLQERAKKPTAGAQTGKIREELNPAPPGENP